MATFKTERESKRFLVPAKTQDDRSFMMRFTRGIVTLNVMGTTVVFQKTNRGQYFSDSREPKKRLTGDEVYAELLRMLDSKDDADKAYAALKV